MRKSKAVSLLGALAMLATSGVTVVLSTQTATAQTQGMERRGDRRDTRQSARVEKRACVTASDNSRAECRQQKRDTKQDARRY
jgi:hypothetical protein